MFEKTKARLEKFEESHDEARVVVDHVKKYQLVYGCAVTAAVTALVMRTALPTSTPNVVTAAESGSNVVAAGKNVIMENVSFIASHRQGPPSWVTRWLETGDVFTSQHSAAIAAGVSESKLSKHLNGLLTDANGQHFERICMAG